MQLVWEKFAHPQPSSMVQRARLLQELQTNLTRYTATVLSGRSGTGKTWLAADFAQSCQRRTAWYRVEASDAALPVFWEYLVCCLPLSGTPQTVVPHALNTPTDYAEALAHLLTEHCEQPLLFVLDDLHLIYDAPWLETFITRLLALTPRSVHFLLVGRGLPPAPLWRLRSKQRVGLIEETALAFTPEETQAWWAQLPDAQDHALTAWRKTRGRAALLASAYAAAQ